MQLPTDERINWRDLDISAITSVDQCQAYVLRCMRDLHNVAESITRRQDDAEAGEALDLGKLRNMQAARQGLGRTHQALNMHLGKLGRQERAARAGQGKTDDDIIRHHLTVVQCETQAAAIIERDERIAALLAESQTLLANLERAQQRATETPRQTLNRLTFEAHFFAVVQESVDETVFLDWRREAEKRGAL